MLRGNIGQRLQEDFDPKGRMFCLENVTRLHVDWQKGGIAPKMINSHLQ